jgi:fluoride exporter
MLTVAVALAAGVGAVARLLVDRGVTMRSSRPLPLGTLLVNVTGSFVLGLTTGLAAHHGLSARLATVLGAGLAGGYTTLSTFAWETVDLTLTDRPLAATGYVLASAAAGLLAAAAGLGLALL